MNILGPNIYMEPSHVHTTGTIFLRRHRSHHHIYLLDMRETNGISLEFIIDINAVILWTCGIRRIFLGFVSDDVAGRPFFGRDIRAHSRFEATACERE
jgi:hypothetical protein